MCVSLVGKHISLVQMSFPGKGTHITSDMCNPTRGTHITRNCYRYGKPIPLQVCVRGNTDYSDITMICAPPTQKHISLVISPTWKPHIPSDKCSSTRETHIRSGMCFPGRRTHITRDMCFLGMGTHFSRGMCFPGRATHITCNMCILGRGTHITRNYTPVNFTVHFLP